MKKNALLNAVYIVAFIVVLFLMFFLNMFNPYYDNQEYLGIFVESRLKTLIGFWSVFLISNVILAFVSKSHKKLFLILFLLLALLCLIKIVTLFMFRSLI